MTHASFSRRSSPYTLHLAAGLLLAPMLLAVPGLLLAQVPAPAGPPTHTVTASRRDTQAAANEFLAGAKLLKNNDVDGALDRFSRAVRLDPANHDYTVALAVAREHQVTDLIQQASKARLLGQNEAASALLAKAVALDPQNTIVAQHVDPGPLPLSFASDSAGELTASIAPPVQLAYSQAALSFHLRGDIQDVVRQTATSYGLRTVFDESAGHSKVRFDLDDVHYGQAMPLLLTMGHLFLVPLDKTSFLVAKDTTENRQRLERMVQETVYLPGFTPEQMTDIGNVVRNVFDIKQVTVEQSSSTLLLRAPENTLRAVNLILADLVDGGSAVMLDLKLYSVDMTKGRNIGTQLPQQVGAFSVAAEARTLVAANQSILNQAISQGAIKLTGNTTQDLITELGFLFAAGLANIPQVSGLLGTVGGGLTSLGVFEGSATTINLALNSSEARTLDDLQLRINDRQIGTFRAGTRYPVITATFSSGLSAAQTQSLAGVSVNGVSAANLAAQYLGTSSAVSIPQIQFEDLGITLKATPTVQKGGEVSMHLDLKIEALAGSSSNSIPILASRQFTSDVTVPDGETALLFSNLSRSESRAVNGIPGLSELPGFRQTLADNVTETDTSQLVLMVTPHVVRHRSSATMGPRIQIKLPENSID